MVKLLKKKSALTQLAGVFCHIGLAYHTSLYHSRGLGIQVACIGTRGCSQGKTVGKKKSLWCPDLGPEDKVLSISPSWAIAFLRQLTTKDTPSCWDGGLGK